jgi:hypothetical protein
MPRRMSKRLSNIRKGDEVKLVNCYEARSGKYDGVVFKVASDPYEMCGSEVVRLESQTKTFPSFATEFLERVS